MLINDDHITDLLCNSNSGRSQCLSAFIHFAKGTTSTPAAISFSFIQSSAVAVIAVVHFNILTFHCDILWRANLPPLKDSFAPSLKQE